MLKDRKFETSIEGIIHGRAALAVMVMMIMMIKKKGKRKGTKSSINGAAQRPSRQSRVRHLGFIPWAGRANNISSVNLCTSDSSNPPTCVGQGNTSLALDRLCSLNNNLRVVLKPLITIDGSVYANILLVLVFHDTRFFN